MERTAGIYRRLGFTAALAEMDGYNEPMHPWYPGPSGPAPRQRLRILMSPYGGWLEPVQLDRRQPTCAATRDAWGDGLRGIGVRDLDRAVGRLRTAGVGFVSGPQTIAVGGGLWRYAYVKEPDGNYAALCEARD